MRFWGSCVQDTCLPKEHVVISGDFTHLTRTKTVPEATVRPCCTSSAGQRVRVHFQSHTQVARVVLAAPGTTCCYGSLFTSRIPLEVWASPCTIAEDVTPDALFKCHVSPDREVDVIKDQSQGQSGQTTPVNQSTKQTPLAEGQWAHLHQWVLGEPAAPSPLYQGSPFHAIYILSLAKYLLALSKWFSKQTWAIVVGKVRGWDWPCPPLEITKYCPQAKAAPRNYVKWIWGTGANAKVSSQNSRAAHPQVCNHTCTCPYTAQQAFPRGIKCGISNRTTILSGSTHKPWLQTPLMRGSG